MGKRPRIKRRDPDYHIGKLAYEIIVESQGSDANLIKLARTMQDVQSNHAGMNSFDVARQVIKAMERSTLEETQAVYAAAYYLTGDHLKPWIK